MTGSTPVIDGGRKYGKKTKNLNDAIASNIIRKCGLLKKLTIIVNSKTLNKKKIMFCGNGGSASEVSHIAAEFVEGI